MTIIRDLKLQIAQCQNKIEEIQSQCSHPTVCVEKTPRSGSTDGHDIDLYWYQCYCKLCEKQWDEDQ